MKYGIWRQGGASFEALAPALNPRVFPHNVWMTSGGRSSDPMTAGAKNGNMGQNSAIQKFIEPSELIGWNAL
jgi:hypothetical protein